MDNKIDDMWIQGDQFKYLCDYTYSPDVKNRDDYDKLANTLDLSKLKDVNLVYTHTMYAKQLFEFIRNSDKKFVIVTHNSDENVTEEHSQLLPSNVIKWFTTNVNVIDPRIESIPIGLENNRWFKRENKIEIMQRRLAGDHFRYKRLLYINHNVKTNTKERLLPYTFFKGLDWVTIEDGKNGNNFTNYIENIDSHRFVLCPEGNGIDTHRLWESLYMGARPIVKKNVNTLFYKDLPIYYVDTWEEINEDGLMDIIINDLLQKREYSHDMLKMSYWKNKIYGALH